MCAARNQYYDLITAGDVALRSINATTKGGAMSFADYVKHVAAICKAYSVAIDFCEEMGVKTSAVSRAVSSFPISFEKEGNVTHARLGVLLPLKCVRSSENLLMDGSYRRALRAAASKGMNDGTLKKYYERIVFCFVNYVPASSPFADYHDFEVKPIIDAVNGILLPDDAPQYVSYYFKTVSGSEDYRSELFIVPRNEFPAFLKEKWGSAKEETGEGNAESLFVPCLQKASVYVNESMKYADECISLYEMNRPGYEERASEILSSLIHAWISLEAAAASYGTENVLRQVHNPFVMDETSVSYGDDGVTSIRLCNMVPRIPSGNSANKKSSLFRFEIPEKLNQLKWIGCEGDFALCFIQHYGEDRGFTDHDNLATEPYAVAIKNVSVTSPLQKVDYFMDLAPGEVEKSYTEIFRVPSALMNEFIAKYVQGELT